MIELNPKQQEALRHEDKLWYAKIGAACNRISKFHQTLFNKYIDIIVDHPFIVLGVTLAVSVAVVVPGILLSPPPQLSQPAMGFEVRGNDLSQRQLLWKNLRKQLSIRYSNDSMYFMRAPRQEKRRRKRGGTFGNFLSSLLGGCTTLTGDPSEDHLIRIILEAKSESLLTSVSVIRSICQFSGFMLDDLAMFNITSYRLTSVSSSSPVWSLPSALSCLASESSCADLTDESIERGLRRLHKCSPYRALLSNCSKTDYSARECASIPSPCRDDILLDAFRHILDKGFGSGDGSRRYTGIILPALAYYAARYKTSDPNLLNYHAFYLQMVRRAEALKGVRLKGVFLGAKFELFHFAVMHDNIYAIVALCLVCAIILLYTRSIFFSVMVGLTLVLSAGVAYTVYHLVFRIPFFPFMNLMIVVLLLGVGADDAVILTHCWSNADEMGYGTTKEMASSAFRHAIVAMLVTSVTTAAAFYANVLSNVIVMKCFGLFAGTAILFNYLLVTTILASSLVIYRVYILSCCNRYTPSHISKLQTRIGESVREVSVFVFATAIPYLVEKLKWFFAITITALVIAAAVVIFYAPGIHLPRQHAFQFFRSNHPFEWYHKYGPSLFAYSRQNRYMDLILIWGFKPVTDAPAFNPEEDGTLHQDDTLDRSSVGLESIRRFIDQFRNQNFSRSEPPRNWIDRFYRWSNRRKCPTPCCNLQGQHLPADTVSHCLYLSTLDRSYGYMSGPIFAVHSNETVGFSYYTRTRFKFSFLHDDNSAFHRSTAAALSNSYDGAKPTPFPVAVSTVLPTVTWYNVQQNLLWSMPTAVLISVAVALLTVLLSTRKGIVSLLSVLSIAGIIMLTVGALVLMGWELNIMESVIIILTGGLSFDYTLHYAICFKLELDRSSAMIRIQKSIAYIGCPVFMAAVTTSAAGLCLVRAHTNAYFQVGVFMVLLTGISWSASTFYFTSLIVLSSDLHSWWCHRLNATDTVRSNDGVETAPNHDQHKRLPETDSPTS